VAQGEVNDIAQITRLQRLKTGALISFACEAGAIMGKASPSLRHALSNYAHDLGLAYQIADDLLDVEGNPVEMGKAAGKDQKAGKATFDGLLDMKPTEMPRFKNTANTNIVWHAGKLLALMEAALPTALAPCTLETLGEWDFGGRLGTAMTAHPKMDPETGETLPSGTPGEICVRGYSLMQGLHKVEREDAFDRDGFYHTGDGGYFDADGVLFFQGRLGDTIKTAGANVSPREVELAIEAFPEVQSAFVVGVPDPVRGQNVAAVVVLASVALLPAGFSTSVHV